MSHVHIESFDSPEEMADWLAEMQKTKGMVQQRVLAPEQEAITFGSHAIRFWDNLVIFVEVPTLEQQSAIEEAEVVDHIKAKESRENTLWIKGYSVDCGDGEYGWDHRSTLWPITEETFNRARAVHWSIDRLWPSAGNAMLEVQSAYYALRNWALDHPDQNEAERAEGEAYLTTGPGAPITEAEAAYFRDKDQS